MSRFARAMLALAAGAAILAACQSLGDPAPDAAATLDSTSVTTSGSVSVDGAYIRR